MKVKTVSSAAFGVAAARGLSLPDTGLVLVTGPNGSGKSTCVEAVSTAVWGKSLRGADLWHDGTPGVAAVTLVDGYTITRARNKSGKQAVAVENAQGTVGPFDTAAAATAFLTERYGSHARWAATCVFRSGDVDRFSSATDAERKALLEELLGLAQFERAAKAARESARDTARAVVSAESLLRAADSAAAQAEQALANAQAVLAAGAPVPAGVLTAEQVAHIKERGLALQAALRDLDADMAAMRAPLAAAQAEVAEARAAARQAEVRLRALCDRAECPTCGQGVGPELVASLRAVAQAAVAAAEQAAASAQLLVQAAAAEDELAAAERGEVQRAMQGLRDELARNQGASQLAAQVAAQRAAAQRAVEAAQAQLADSTAQRADLHAKLDAARYDARVADAAERVLGTRGVRAMLLTSLLAAVEGAANWWLGKLSGNQWTLALGGTKELKSGAQSDVITLEVTGVAGGRGYKAMSSGQRRRVDLALLLGLAEVSGGAAEGAATLWFDECMDALDTEGVAAVCAMLRDLSAERCVVVISHSEELVASLRGDAVQRVEL